MIKITKNYVLDENQNPIAAQIPLDDFTKIEEVLENFGLAKLMEETDDDELLSEKDAETVFSLLENPPAPNENLKQAAEKHKAFFSENH